MKNAKVKNPWLAVCLSWILPGTGQLYAKRNSIGITILFVYLSLLVALFYSMVSPMIVFHWAALFFTLSVLLAIWNLFNAHKLVRNHNASLPPDIPADQPQKNTWLAVFLSYILPGVGQLYCKRWVKGIIFIIGFALLDEITFQHRWVSLLLALLYRLIVCYDAFVSAQRPQKEPKKTLITFLVLLLLYKVFIYVLLTSLLVTYRIPTKGMEPAIMEKDRIIVEKLTYRFSNPEPGDIITFESPEDPQKVLIRRIIANGSQTVEVKGNKAYVNGKLFKEYPQLEEQINTEPYGPYLVPNNTYFVIGDNLTNSKDSRQYGPIPKEKIIGKTCKIYWPVSRIKKIIR